ncbi:MAG: AAA family ATPase [Desulfuromonas sp.]|nr:AAA family ATPase [Desulfuromonas sp.]
MILRSLELKSFGQFIDQKYEFRRGINLVIGPNEAGKSTMMEAVPAVLFGCKDKKRFRPWARSQHCSASLMLENQQYNISIERDIDTDCIELRQADDLYQEQCNLVATVPVDGHCVAKLDYLHLLKKFIGISDERLFRSSLFLGQGDFPSNAEEIKRHMRTLLSGFARGDSTLVLQSIQDDYLAITNDAPWLNKQVSARELEAVQDALDDVYAQREHMQQLKAEAQHLSQQIEVLQQNVANDRREYEKGVEYLVWIQQQWQLAANGAVTSSEKPAPSCADKEDDSAEIAALERERNHLQQILVSAGLPEALPAELPSLLVAADEIRCALVALQQQTIPLHKEVDALRFPQTKRWLLISLLMVASLAGVSFLWPQYLAPASITVGATLAICWGSFAWRYRRQKLAQCHLEQQIAAIDLQRAQERSHLKELDDDFESYGFASSAIAMVKMQKQLQGHEHIVQRLAELRLLLSPNESPSSGGDPTEDGCSAEDEEIEACQDQHSDALAKHLHPDELPAAQQNLAELQKVIKKQEVELLALLRQEAVLQERLSAAEQLGTTETELRHSLDELMQRKEVLGCAYQVLTDAMSEFSHTNLRALEEEVGKYLRQATMGKYVAVEITENYALRLRRAGQRGKSSPLENLSRGTIDLVCLATRLALTRFLANDEFLPFFLDDALVNLDSDRLLETVDALERISTDHQIVMFTHDERLYKLASRRRWHIVSLGLRSKRRKVNKKEEVSANDGQLSLL